MTQSLWIPGPMPSLNDIIESAKGAGGSGKRYAKAKEVWTTHVWAHAKKARLRTMGRVRVQFVWWETERRKDPDNIAAGKKYVFDGLVAAGVLEGDGWDHVDGWEDAFRVGKSAGVEVTLTEVE